MKKTVFTIILCLFIGTIIIIPGCGCETEHKSQDEKPQAGVENGDFKGPAALPSSVGPSGPPPEE